MLSFGFNQSEHDPCLYMKGANESLIYVTVFVDDLIIGGASQEIIDQFKKSISTKFNMKDLGPLKYCLGMQIDQDISAGTVKLSQAGYATEILRRFGMMTANSSPIPMDPKTQLPVLDGVYET